MSLRIAPDWGPPNLRACDDRDPVVVKSRHSEAGVTRLNGRSHQQVFDELWQYPLHPIIRNTRQLPRDAGSGFAIPYERISR